MFPKIYDSLGKKIGVLNTIESIKVTENLSRKWILSLRTPIDDKSDLINASTTLDVNGQVFYPIRKKSARNSSGEAVYDINYEHISYIGNNEALSVNIFAHTGTSVDMFNHLMTLSGAPFTLGTFADTTTVATITINERVSVRRVLEVIAETFNLEVEYDNLIVNMPTQIGNDKGFIFTENLNVEGVKVEEDYLENQTSIEIKGIELQNTEEAKSGILKALIDTKLGDVVNVKTEKFTGKTRIYEYSYNPLTGERFDSEWTLTSKLSNFTTANTKSKFQTVYKGRAIYGIDINDQDGFEVERYDKLARTRINADEWRAQKGDGLGSYTDSLYFDVIDQEYKFIGNIDATGTITGADFIGGTINIGSGEFTVDNAGNAFLNSITFGPSAGIGALAFLDDIDLSYVIDAGTVASLDSISSTYIDDGAVITPKLAAGSVIASKISVGSLSAISADLGSINAGDITSVTIDSSIIEGSLFRSTIGEGFDRLEIQSAGTQIKWYEAGVTSSIALIDGQFSSTVGLTLWNQDSTEMQILSDGDMRIDAIGDLELWGSSLTFNGSPIGGGGFDTAGTGLSSSGSTVFVDLPTGDRSFYIGEAITRPYFTGNYCYVDTNGTTVTFRDASGTAVTTI